jgi:hypothetical protein
MRGLRHPLSGATYELDEDGAVRVTAKDGRAGRFTATGRWLEGELRAADAHLCQWIGGQAEQRRLEARDSAR